MIQVKELILLNEKILFYFYILVYLVTYDIDEQKELLQTKFHRNNENILSLAKNLVNIE
jgi:hypothetical protein